MYTFILYYRIIVLCSVDVKCYYVICYLHDFLEHVVQRCVAVSHHQNLLCGVIVVQVAYDLHGHIRLARARWSHNHSQSLVHSRTNCLHLYISKATR
jgi:hypothetical protein